MITSVSQQLGQFHSPKLQLTLSSTASSLVSASSPSLAGSSAEVLLVSSPSALEADYI